MHIELLRKTELQHTTLVWYGGLCTNKYDKVLDISIKCLVMQNIQLYVLTFHMAGTVNHATNNETAKIMVPY